MKIYNNKNVYEAAMERFEIVLNSFDNYYVSVSGGKDSSIMLQLMAKKAREIGKRFSVLYIDLEAQYKSTIDHVNELIDCTADVVEDWYWVAMPLSLRNAVSAIQPKWICWDKKDKKNGYVSILQRGRMWFSAQKITIQMDGTGSSVEWNSRNSSSILQNGSTRNTAGVLPLVSVSDRMRV